MPRLLRLEYESTIYEENWRFCANSVRSDLFIARDSNYPIFFLFFGGAILQQS